MLWMLKFYRATASGWINSRERSPSVLFLAKRCLSPECQLLRKCYRNLLPLCSVIRGLEDILEEELWNL